MKVGNGKKSHKDKPALYFLFPTQKGPLLMRVNHGGALAVEGVMDALDGGGA